jgi:hypothetical protein
VRVAGRVRCGRARHPGIVQGTGDPGGAVPGQPLREHPLNDRRGGRVRLEAARPAAPRGMGLVRVRPGVRQPVPVRRTAAQVPALLPGLRGHRGAHPDPGPGDLPLGRQPQREHGLLMILGMPVHPAADFRHPQLDPVVLEQRRHGRGLVPRRTPARTPRSRSRPTRDPDPPKQPPEQRPAGAWPTAASGSPPYRRTAPLSCRVPPSA